VYFSQKGVTVSIALYDGITFALDRTSGEAQQLFGKMSDKAKPPTIKINVDRKTSLVTFMIKGANPAKGRNFAKEAAARYIDGDQFESATWPDPVHDMIVGHINYGVEGSQQLFLMWVRQDVPLQDPTKPLKLGFFIFANRTRFSTGSGDMMIKGIGQVNGGGSGTGPH
jgi:hypothetical protein